MKQLDLQETTFRSQEKAFSQLYAMYNQNLYRAICKIVRDKEEAEDILQEAFVKIWSKIELFDANKGRFYTWALNIAKNTAIDKLRSRSYRDNRRTIVLEGDFDFVEKGETEILPDEVGVRNLITRLQPKYTEIINLLYFQGFTQEEASEELGIPLGTLKTRNRTCLKELRTFLIAQPQIAS